MNVHNKTKKTIIANQAKRADSFWTRLVGLLRTPQLLTGEALLITSCQQIHMFGMKYALDVIFVDKNDVVVGLVENIAPGKLSRIFWKASYAIELPVGTITATQTQVGDQIIVE